MISFIIPANNEAKYIGGCLDSIFVQDFGEEFEVIVVNNNSADNTASLVLEKYPAVKIVEEKLPGTVAARQKGYAEATGSVLIFLDADVRLPNALWLAKLVEKIAPAEVVAVSTHYKYYGMSPLKKVLQIIGTFCFVYPWVFLMNNILHHSAHLVGGMTAVKKPALDEVGGLGQGTEFFGDEALLSQRLYPLGKIIVSPSLWVYTSGRRYNKNGIIKTVFQYLINYFWVIITKKPLNKKGYNSVR